MKDEGKEFQLLPEKLEYIYTDLDEELDNVSFKTKISKASINVSEIRYIVVGGSTSRFWMLRKHINCCSNEELKFIPFYSWNCVTISLPSRDVDIVIRNEKDMERFLKFIIFSIKTVDGKAGSGKKLLNAMIE